MPEIPAGDYVPQTKPLAAPIITSLTNGRNGTKPRIEVSQEPLIDDIDENEAEDTGDHADGWTIRTPIQPGAVPTFDATAATSTPIPSMPGSFAADAAEAGATPPADDKVKNMLDSFIEEQTKDVLAGHRP